MVTWPAVRAQAGVSAVTISRAAVIGKASAKVSSMGMSCICKSNAYLFIPATALAMRSITSCHTPHVDCLKSRIVGYQGLSSRFINQRHSDCHGRATNTLVASAAKWAIAVSQETTTSRFLITAAMFAMESVAGPSRFTKSSTGNSPPSSPNCSVPAPYCRLMSRTPLTAANGAKRARGMERSLSIRNVLLPCQTMPILIGAPGMAGSFLKSFQLPLPRCDQARFSVDIGHRRGNGGKIGLKDARKRQ